MLKLNPAAHGILLIDKPSGITSQGVVKKIKWLTRAKKVGHTGTLDPMATGLLPVCLGEATKFSQFLLDGNKTYEATLTLGEQTDTGDFEGAVVASAGVPELDDQQIQTAMAMLQGSLMQVPPMYAAIKVNGKKLYEYAREGITLERAARPIRVYEFGLLELIQGQSGVSIRFHASVSKGTYIRALGEDLAKKLGTLGHLSQLRRTSTSCFNLSTAHSLVDLEQISQLTLLPPDAGLGHLRYLQLEAEQIRRLRIGQRLNIYAMMNQLTPATQSAAIDSSELKREPSGGVELIRVGSADERFAGLCELEADGRLQPKRMIHPID